MTAPTKPKTIRVRIAVAVTSNGCWTAAGWNTQPSGSPLPDADLIGVALESLDQLPPDHVVFVEADVPVPEPVTVEGQVAASKSQE